MDKHSPIAILRGSVECSHSEGDVSEGHMIVGVLCILQHVEVFPSVVYLTTEVRFFS